MSRWGDLARGELERARSSSGTSALRRVSWEAELAGDVLDISDDVSGLLGRWSASCAVELGENGRALSMC